MRHQVNRSNTRAPSAVTASGRAAHWSAGVGEKDGRGGPRVEGDVASAWHAPALQQRSCGSVARGPGRGSMPGQEKPVGRWRQPGPALPRVSLSQLQSDKTKEAVPQTRCAARCGPHLGTAAACPGETPGVCGPPAPRSQSRACLQPTRERRGSWEARRVVHGARGKEPGFRRGCLGLRCNVRESGPSRAASLRACQAPIRML